MKQITLGSLFDGLGGWQIAAVRAGVKPIWSSEIEKFPLALTKARFPETKQLGDVTKIDGTKIEAPDILTAGSPCQNLSVAGNREGLKGEQSGLFRDSIRIVRELRRATNGKSPRFFCWENVPGAFTSGSERGADFRAVLESLAETDIPMPKDGRWANAGVVQCPNCEIAWRTLDAQYWGVPQRRKRIFLVCDFAETDRRAAKILFVEPCLSGNTEQSGETGKRTPSTTEKSIRTASELINNGGNAVVKIRSGKDDGTAGKGALIGLEQSFTLGCGNDQTLFQEQQFVDVYNGAISGQKSVTLTAASGNVNTSGPKVLEQKWFDAYQHHNWREAETLGPVTTAGNCVRGDTPLVTENVSSGDCYCMGHDERSAQFHADKTDPLTASDYKQPPVVAQETVYTIPHDERSMCCKPDVADTMSHYVNYVAICKEEQKETEQDEESFCVGDGQLHQMYLSDKVGALNCMHNGGQKVLVPYQKNVGSLCAVDGPKGCSGQYAYEDKLIVEKIENEEHTDS